MIPTTGLEEAVVEQAGGHQREVPVDERDDERGTRRGTQDQKGMRNGQEQAG